MRKTKVAPAVQKSNKINSADIMVILLVLVFIVGMVFRFGVIQKIDTDSKKQSATVSFVVEDISSSSAGFFHVGDMVYFASDMKTIGTISEVSEPVASQRYIYTDDGNIVLTEATDGKVDIRANMTVLGEKTERGFMLDGTTYIAPNMSIEIKTKHISVTLLITNIEIKG